MEENSPDSENSILGPLKANWSVAFQELERSSIKLDPKPTVVVQGQWEEGLEGYECSLNAAGATVRLWKLLKDLQPGKDEVRFALQVILAARGRMNWKQAGKM